VAVGIAAAFFYDFGWQIGTNLNFWNWTWTVKVF